jgi:hypothetical protein
MTIRETLARIALSLVCVVSLAAFVACPPASQQPPAVPVNAQQACSHADAVCPGTLAACTLAASRIQDTSFVGCVWSANSCVDLNGCDK